MRPTQEAKDRFRAAVARYRDGLVSFGVKLDRPTLTAIGEGDHLTADEAAWAARFSAWLHGERHARGPMTVREVVALGTQAGAPRVSIAVVLFRARSLRHHDVFWKRLPGKRLAHDLGFGLITEAEATIRRPARAARGLLRDDEST